jgi:hypothetical protein
MLRINDTHAIKLIMEAATVQYVPALHYCIADYNSRDCLRGGVLYTDFWGGSIMMHTAGFQKNWLSRALLWIAFDYPFDKLGVRKVFSPIPEWNWPSRNFCMHLGFKIECKMEDVFNRDDGVNGMHVLSLRKEECKWLDMPRPELKFASLEQTSSPTIH